MPQNLKNAYLGLMCLLALVGTGCVETSTMYHGSPVSAVQVVALQEGGPNAGRWETFDIVIDYEYVKEGEIFEISTQIALGQHQQTVYDHLRSLYVYLFFLDGNSRVLETLSFVTHLSGSTEDRLNVSQRYKLPVGAEGFSFGYSGEIYERDGRSTFYQLPLKK